MLKDLHVAVLLVSFIQLIENLMEGYEFVFE